MKKTETLTFKLAKLMIAVSWADGKIDNSEVNALKELLFSIPKLDARQWAELEIYMDSPVDESERGFLLEDVLAALRNTSEKNQVLETLEALIAVDGKVSEEEKTVFRELKSAIESRQTGVLGLFSQLTGRVLKKKSEVGKDAVLTGMRNSGVPLFFAVTVTTRPQREGENDGVDYHFISKDRFEQMVENHELLEWANV